jgi:hypothetical protein
LGTHDTASSPHIHNYLAIIKYQIRGLSMLTAIGYEPFFFHHNIRSMIARSSHAELSIAQTLLFQPFLRLLTNLVTSSTPHLNIVFTLQKSQCHGRSADSCVWRVVHARLKELPPILGRTTYVVKAMLYVRERPIKIKNEMQGPLQLIIKACIALSGQV